MSKSQGVKNEVKNFVENISILGIPRIIKTNDIFLKIFWLIVVLISAGVLCWQLVRFYLENAGYPVTTSYGEELRDSTIFPDITICSLYPLSLSENVPFNFDQYYEFLENNCNDNDELKSIDYYFANLRKVEKDDDSCPKFISSCFIFDKNMNKFDYSDHIKTFWHPTYYTCFTLSVNESIVNQIYGASFIIYLEREYKHWLIFSSDINKVNSFGVRVSVHPRETAPDMKRGSSAGVGTETTFKITQTTRTRLSKPYSAYDCTSEELMLGSAKDFNDYETCQEVCLQNFIAKKCNCLDIYLRYSMDQLKNYIFCGTLNCTEENICNCDIGEKNLDCLYKLNTTEAVDFCDKTCIPSCKKIIYDIVSHVSTWPHPSYELDIYDQYVNNCIDSDIESRFSKYKMASDDFQKTGNFTASKSLLQNETLIKDSFLQLKFIMEKAKPFYLIDTPKHSWETIMGAVGGILSLWLGITFMTGIEFIEFIYSLVTLCCKKKKNFQDNIALQEGF